jgi:hypothetical protein
VRGRWHIGCGRTRRVLVYHGPSAAGGTDWSLLPRLGASRTVTEKAHLAAAMAPSRQAKMSQPRTCKSPIKPYDPPALLN